MLKHSSWFKCWSVQVEVLKLSVDLFVLAALKWKFGSNQVAVHGWSVEIEVAKCSSWSVQVEELKCSYWSGKVEV